jgi:tetratricopeptide (TPR) repeat protein
MTSTDAHKKKTTTTSKTSKTTTKTTTRGNSDAKKEENDDTADGLQKQALNKFEAKQYRDAVQLCSKCLSIDKDSAKALHLRGRCWSQLGAFHEAIKDFKECQAVAEGKENNEYAIACAQSLMGMYRKTGDYEASVLAGEEILKRGLKIENETLEEEVDESKRSRKKSNECGMCCGHFKAPRKTSERNDTRKRLRDTRTYWN